MHRHALALVAFMLAIPPLHAADIPGNIAAAVASPERSAKDRERDVRDKPAELLAFAGVKPGMKVADVFGGGGYWSELLALAVGPAGSVTLFNNPGYYNYARDDLKARFGEGRMSQVRQRVVETCNLDLGRGQYDLVVLFMAYHDIYWVDEGEGWPKIDADRFLAQVHDALRPGGHLLLVDHAARAGTGSTAAGKLHRIDEDFAQQDMAGHGFRLEKEWTGYRNSTDDHSKLVFDPAVRGKTDRFTHLYRRD